MIMSATLIKLIERKRENRKGKKKDMNVKWDLLGERREPIEVGGEVRKKNGVKMFKTHFIHYQLLEK